MFDAGIPTNKGARVRLAGERITGERFFATYGDGIGDVDINALLAFHRSHGKLATLSGYQPYSQYGVLDVSDNQITALREKPRLSNWVNAGFFVFERAVLDYLPGSEEADLEKEALDAARPTAVNLAWATSRTLDLARHLVLPNTDDIRSSLCSK